MASYEFEFKKILLLGSQSPRRKALIEQMFIPYRSVVIDFDESGLNTADPVVLAKEKSKHYPHPLAGNEVLLTADTLVLLDGKPLGKPANQYEALDMLESLSGKTHSVTTGVCLREKNNLYCFDDTTEIRFRELSKEEMNFYVCRFMPYDKAGAYGIQEWIGMIGVESIKGSFYNVMGLPTEKFWINWLKINNFLF